MCIGIFRVTRDFIAAQRAESEFGRVRLANDYSACIFQARNHKVIRFWDVMDMSKRSFGRPNALRCHQIFDPDRNAVQRPQELAAPGQVVKTRRLLPCGFRANGNECVDISVQAFNGFQACVDRFDGADSSTADGVRQGYCGDP